MEVLASIIKENKVHRLEGSNKMSLFTCNMVSTQKIPKNLWNNVLEIVFFFGDAGYKNKHAKLLILL
jgi:hypothetical protein